ncbi:hypothetical protein EJB05_55335 [Eragrostis curvula]|uniref:Uncharacterized protein n=1 Tax=Eragrostis curvula TaxID=38414 RepID=A0A5J9SK03_9POAL|nr:hypothetical protein EJB05_55335 [Eragrostis curvula]
MLGVGAGAPAPPLVRAPPLVVAPRLPPFFSFPLRRRGRTSAAAAAKQNQGRRRWWSDSDQVEYDDEEEDYDDFFPGGSLGGELFDEPWFSKVFKTYGYLLPVMLASMLVATGPRAFLMAMAIPLGQSAISFLLDAIWGRNGRRRQPPFEEEYEEEEEEEDFPKYSSDFASASGRDRSSSSYYGRWRQSYQSWVSNDFVAEADDYSSNDRGGGPKTSGFGGWDELLDKDDDATQARNKASSRPPQPITDAAARGPGAPLSRKRARMSASTKYKQAPMLMRLLVAVFPFLGSWFRLL